MAIPFVGAALAGGSFLNRAGPAIGLAADAIKSISPTLEQNADVIVYGRPDSVKADLYWQAVSIAFGLMQRRDLLQVMPPAGYIALEYNAEKQWVRFTVQQVTPWLSIMASLKGSDNNIQLFKGPPNSVTGGAWQWNSKVLSGFPGKITALGFTLGGWEIKTNYEGREMITPNPTYKDARNVARVSRSPFPDGDTVSRGRPTIASSAAARATDPAAWYTSPEYLLFSALRGPCDPGPQAFETTLKSEAPVSLPQPFPNPALSGAVTTAPATTTLTADQTQTSVLPPNPFPASTLEYPPPGSVLTGFDEQGFGIFTQPTAEPLGFISLPPGTLPIGGFKDLSQSP